MARSVASIFVSEWINENYDPNRWPSAAELDRLVDRCLHDAKRRGIEASEFVAMASEAAASSPAMTRTSVR